MNAATAAALSRINERFYARYDNAFSASRSRPWSGWNRAIKPFQVKRQTDAGSEPASILDVGCGNGRFGVFLDSVQGGTCRYLGLDNSSEMIRLARRSLVGCGSLEASFTLQDLVDTEAALELGSRTFDLIVVFGVLHHLPGFERRRHLLEDLAGRVAPGGFLILSFWQFANKDRFDRRILSWSDHNLESPEKIDESQLEDGDFLLAWGNRGDSVASGEDPLGPRRYCHHAGPEEARALTESLELRTVDRFTSDGRPGDLNLYVVLQAGL